MLAWLSPRAPASHSLAIDFAVADVDGDGDRITELTFVKINDVGDGLGESGRRVGNACVVDDIDHQALAVVGAGDAGDAA